MRYSQDPMEHESRGMMQENEEVKACLEACFCFAKTSSTCSTTAVYFLITGIEKHLQALHMKVNFKYLLNLSRHLEDGNPGL